MSEPGSHCYVWAWRSDGDLCSRCAHCGHEYRSWASQTDDDIERVIESQENHKDRCPGTPWCVRKRRRY